MRSKILIVGGGIIGLTTALELVGPGVDITIIDQSEIGREASWAAGGILSPLHPWHAHPGVNVLSHWSQAAYPELVERLHRDTGVDCERVERGMLICDSEELSEALQWGAEFNRPVELLSPKQAKELEPQLTEQAADALWFPNIAQLRNPRLIKALTLELERKGVRFESANPATSFEFNCGRAVGIQTKFGYREADIVVVATGAWTGSLMMQTALNVPIEPIRGQMIALQTRPGLISATLMKGFRYLIPRRDGLVVVGSTIERAGFDKGATENGRSSLICSATDLVPALTDAPVVHHWAGLRPAAPGGIPFIGPHPDVENLYINAGHFRNGINLAPASARLLADLIHKRTPTFDPAPYTLDRGKRC